MKTVLNSFLCILFFLVSCAKDHNSNHSQEEEWPDARHQESKKPEVDESLLTPPDSPENIKILHWKGRRLSTTDKSFLEIQTNRNKSIDSFNHIELSKGTREIIISARHLVFDKNDYQGLRRLLNNQNDISLLTIQSERIDIEAPLHFPSTKVVIYSRELNFSKNGSINITPLPYQIPAKQFSDGKSGLPSPSLSLYIRKFSTSRKNKIHFFLNGGEGQAPGEGQDGANGIDRADLGGGLIAQVSTMKVPCSDNIKRANYCSHLRVVRGSLTEPTKGKNAKPPGRPGIGGHGGHLHSSLHLDSRLYDLNGGHSAPQAKNTRGGEPGKPNPYKIQYLTHGRINTYSNERGQDAIAPKALESRGMKGIFQQNDQSTWMSEGLLKYSYQYANHLYKKNYLQQAKHEFAQILKDCQSQKDILNEKQQIHCQKIIHQHYKLTSHVDYYGHTAAWVPNLSFEASFGLFNEEIEEGFQTLYLTYWAKNRQQSLESQIQVIETQQGNLEKKIDQFKFRYQQVTKEIPSIKLQMENLNQKQVYFDIELLKVEKEINKEAQSNITPNSGSFLKRALKTFAAISRVIPVAQPSFGAAATTLEKIVNGLDKKKPLQFLLKELPDQVKHLTPSRILDSQESWAHLRNDIGISEFKRIFELTPENSKLTKSQILSEKKKYFKKIEAFLSPMAKQFTEQVRTIQSTQVSRQDLQNEINRIKSSHPLFIDLNRKLKELISAREKLHQDIFKLNNETIELQTAIQESFSEMASLSESKAQLLEGHFHKLQNTLTQIEAKQKEKLERYFYLFKKAYQYRFVEEYPNDIDSKNLFEKVKRMAEVSNNGELSPSEFLILKEAYLLQLREVTDAIITDFQQSYTNTKSIRLTNEQIFALNKGHTIYLDLSSKYLFGNLREENLRIIDLNVGQLEFQIEGTPLNIAEGRLKIEYDGRSYIQRNGHSYLFEINDQKYYWGATRDLLRNTFSPIEPAHSNNSLLSTLLGNYQEGALFTKPGLLTSLKVSLEESVDNRAKLILDSADLEISYEYSHPNKE